MKKDQSKPKNENQETKQVSNLDVEKINEFVAKIDQMKKQDKMDLSSDQDLSIAIMNLIGVEEHLFFTAEKTGKKEYYDILLEIRDMRKELLKMIIKEYEGEVWCISKHLLAASYRLMEVGTKQLSMGKKEKAHEFFKKSHNLYSLFWALNMDLVNVADAKGLKNEIEKGAEESKGLMCKLGNAVNKGLDCCIE